MGNGANLHFSGVERSALEAAADALLAHFGAELASVLVAVPGAHAGRLLRSHLRRAAKRRGVRAYVPPEVVTQGRLIDELLVAGAPSASRIVRTFAWEAALRSASIDELAGLLPKPPERGDRLAWWRLAERVRTLHAELASEGIAFEDLAAGPRAELAFEGDPGPDASERERLRWRSLARVEALWRAELEAAGLADPHDLRNAALAEMERGRRAAPERRVALVGVVDAPGLLRRALARLAQPPEVFVAASESDAAGFDRFGMLVPSYWTARRLALSLERWHVVTDPREQAELALALAAREGGARHAGEVTIGVADEEVVPHLVRTFEAHGARARPAVGTPLERTAPARLLRAAAAWLDGRRARDAAALVRHPDLEAWLASRLPGIDLATHLDAHRARHLPARFDGALPPATPLAERAALESLFARLDEWLGPLAREASVTAKRGVAALRDALGSVYSGAALDGATESERELRESLAALGETLAELESVPERLGTELPPPVLLELVVRSLAGRFVPPAPEEPGVPTVHLLGWLDLALDDAPHLVVTGFGEGRVPSAPRADSFLPDSARSRLGLEDDARRHARDAYAVATMIATRERVDFVSARRTREGDPLSPSRLAFQVADEEVPARLRHAARPRASAPRRTAAPAIRYKRPDLSARPKPDVFSVTDFRVYLESSYVYALARMLRFEPIDDGARELDGRGFGSLLHRALEVLGEERYAACADAAELRDALLGRLERAARELFGAERLPALGLQVEQARNRLVAFAEWQAARARAGWRVHAVEWTPPRVRVESVGRELGVVSLGMRSDEPAAWLRGKIDRIDRHADGRLAILDYKTGAKAADPDKARVKGEWRDLQLPLYARLTEPLRRGAQGVPELGYVTLLAAGVDDRLAKGWTDSDVESALERAREIVRQIRSGAFDVAKADHRMPPSIRELLGVGLIVEPAAAEALDGDGGESGAEAG